MFMFLFLLFSVLVLCSFFRLKELFQKWFNYVVTFFLENAKNLGRSDDAKRGKKKDGLLDEKHRIAVQGIFVGIIIKAGGASVKVTDLLFLFAFCKK